MTIQSEIYSRLSGYAALTAIVGTRICPIRLPQNTSFPAVTFQIISANRPSAFSSDTGDVQYRIQVDIYARKVGTSTNNQLIETAAEVKNALKRYSGGNIQDIFLESERDGYQEKGKLYRKSQDYIVWFKE